MVELYRAMTPQQRIKRAFGLSQAMRELTRAQLRKLYPDASEDELRVRFAQRTLGKELTREVFGRIYED
jgi:hypothetical protein